jgi:hypothetical protein
MRCGSMHSWSRRSHSVAAGRTCPGRTGAAVAPPYKGVRTATDYMRHVVEQVDCGCFFLAKPQEGVGPRIRGTSRQGTGAGVSKKCARNYGVTLRKRRNRDARTKTEAWNYAKA